MSETAPASETGSTSAAHEISRGELHEATLDAVRWISIARIFAEIVAFSSGIVLAHLVSPAEFGRLAVAVIVNEMAEAITGQGLGNALVQRKVLRRAHLQGGMAIGVGTGVGLMGLTLVLGPLVVTPLFGAQTATLFELFSVVFLLSGIKIVPLAILQRKLDFRTSSLVELSGSLLSAFVAVALAASLGLQAKSYVFGQIAAGVLTLVLLLLATKPPLPRLRLAEIRELLAFGLPAAFAGLTWVIQRNIDYMILGVRLSAAQVGYYYRAYTVSFEGESKISGIITRLALPVYARTEDLAHMRSLRARIVRANATTVFPVLGLFIVLAPEVMPWLFGAHWQPAVLPAQILAVAGMAATINNANSPLLLAAGRPRELSIFNVFQLVGYAATILVCSTHGLVTVCIGVAAFQLAVTVAYAVILNRLVQMPAGQLFSDLAAAVLCTGAMAAVAVALSRALAGAELPMPVSPTLVGIGATLTYLTALRLAFPAAWSDVLMIAIRIVPARIRQLVPSAVRRVLVGRAAPRASVERPEALNTAESSQNEQDQEVTPPNATTTGKPVDSTPWPIHQSA